MGCQELTYSENSPLALRVLKEGAAGAKTRCTWKYQWDLIHDPESMIGVFEDDEEGALVGPYPSDRTGTYEGEKTVTQERRPSGTGGISVTDYNWYWHNAFESYQAYDPETDSEVTVTDEYETGWYPAEEFCEIHKYLIWDIGIANGDVAILPTNQNYQTLRAENALVDFFSNKTIDADFYEAIKVKYTDYCEQATNHLSGSGMVIQTNTVLNIMMELTAVGIAGDILHILRANRLFKAGGKKLFFQASKLTDEAGELLANYSDGALRNVKFIEEGGEVLGRSENVIKFVDDEGNTVESYFELIVKDEKLGFRRIINANSFFTNSQIDDYVVFATKQNDQTTKVMLGKFEGKNNPLSYHMRAGNDHSYFDMGDKWDEALEYVYGDLDEMWKINKKFIDNQRAMGKEFYLSHNPSDPKYYKGFYKREIDYLTKSIDQGGLGGQIIDQGNNLWKIVW